MARTTTYVCSNCGTESAKWHGRCPGCEEWNTLVEERIAPAQAGPRGGSGGGASRRAAALKPVRLADVEAPAVKRLVTGIGELRIIHGHGTGQLRRAVGAFLRDHPLVARVETAPQNQGGGGATVVVLKD